MALTEAPQPTVREALVSAMDTVEKASTPPPTETPPAAEAAPPAAAVPVETEAQKAERLRDEKGRFVEGKPEAKKPEAKPAAAAAPSAEAKPAEAVKPKAPRPSSWKKDFEGQWDQLPPELQSYIGQREREYATGVSTYKTEADRAKTVLDAIAPFEPHLQQHGVPVQKWLTDLGNAHHTLALGSPQDKVMQVARIIQGYGVDAQALFQVMSGQQPQYSQAPAQVAPPAPRITPEDIGKVVEEKLLNRQATDAFTTFTKDVNEGKYPHYEDVKPTMIGFLQAGLAEDYPSAYEAALRHPKHANLWDAMQKQQATEKEADTVKAAAETAKRARSQAVSVKSSTPTTQPAADGKKGLREQLSEAVDRTLASGRV